MSKKIDARIAKTKHASGKETDPACEPCRRAVVVSPLMHTPCTHRLGAYRGGQW